jgi:hypothetical protein
MSQLPIKNRVSTQLVVDFRGRIAPIYRYVLYQMSNFGILPGGA